MESSRRNTKNTDVENTKFGLCHCVAATSKLQLRQRRRVVCLIDLHSTTQVVSSLHATVLGKSCMCIVYNRLNIDREIYFFLALELNGYWKTAAWLLFKARLERNPESRLFQKQENKLLLIQTEFLENVPSTKISTILLSSIEPECPKVSISPHIPSTNIMVILSKRTL